MAAQFVANLIRLKEEGFTPDRDLILALTADEEGGTFNGVDWLVKNHRDLIDAEFAINEGGGGNMRKGKYLTNEVQASEKVFQDFRLEVTNPGGHSSLPVKDNAIYHLSDGLARLAAFDFPVRAERGDARLLRAIGRRSQTDPKMAADMRAVARPTPDLAAAARLSASLPYYNAHDADDLRRDAARRAATRTTRCRSWRARTSTAASCRACRPTSVKDKLVEVLADPKITVVVRRRGEPEQAVAAAPRCDERRRVAHEGRCSRASSSCR